MLEIDGLSSADVDGLSSADVGGFIFFVSLRSQVIISCDQDDESVDVFVGFKILIKPFRKFSALFNFHKRWMPWINVLGIIKADWS